MLEVPGDDTSSNMIRIPHPFPYFGRTYTSMYVNINGHFTFKYSLSTYTPLDFPIGQNTPIVSPYWGDVDSSYGGKIWHRSSTDPAILDQAARELHTDRCIAWVYIATWVEVPFFDATWRGMQKRNTFQAILAVDDT